MPLCLNHRFGRLKDCTDKAENGKVESVGVGLPNPLGGGTPRPYDGGRVLNFAELAPEGRHVYSQWRHHEVSKVTPEAPYLRDDMI